MKYLSIILYIVIVVLVTGVIWFLVKDLNGVD